ncbi:MAG: basic amino acid ABC transporter substrate-binding protein [Desulfovibrionaceae bacterium]
MFRTLSMALITLCLLAGSAFAAAEKTVVFASDATWPPMELLDNKKQVVGYSADYVNAVAKELNMPVEVRNVAWDGIFAGLAAGNYDAVASSVTITPERQKQFLFTTPYAEIHQALVVPANSPLKNMAELKGKKVGGQIGTTGIFVMQNAKTGAVIREYEDVGLAMEDLANARIDAVMCDGPVAQYYANKNKDFTNKFKLALTTPDAEYYGFALNKKDTALQTRLNKGIKAVQEKGIEKQLQQKWFGQN